MDSQDMLSQGSKGRRQLVTFCHMLAEKTPPQFRDGIDADAVGGVYATHTKLARLANIESFTSTSVESICRELITFLSAFMYTCIPVALPIRENLPMLSVPVNAWNFGSFCPYGAPYWIYPYNTRGHRNG